MNLLTSMMELETLGVLFSIGERTSISVIKKNRDEGSPCLNPFLLGKYLSREPLIIMENIEVVTQARIQTYKPIGVPIASKKPNKKSQLTES